MGHKVQISVELLRLQKAAGFGHLEDTKLGWEGKARRWDRLGAGEAAVPLFSEQQQWAPEQQGGAHMQEKPTHLLVFALRQQKAPEIHLLC